MTLSTLKAPCILAEPRNKTNCYYPDLLGAIVTQNNQDHIKTVANFPINMIKTSSVLLCLAPTKVVWVSMIISAVDASASEQLFTIQQGLKLKSFTVVGDAKVCQQTRTENIYHLNWSQPLSQSLSCWLKITFPIACTIQSFRIGGYARCHRRDHFLLLGNAQNELAAQWNTQAIQTLTGRVPATMRDMTKTYLLAANKLNQEATQNITKGHEFSRKQSSILDLLLDNKDAVTVCLQLEDEPSVLDDSVTRNVYCPSLFLQAISPVMNKVFSNAKRDPKHGLKIKFDGVYASTFEQVVLFFKYGLLPLTRAACVRLLSFADKFEVVSLQDACDQWLAERICTKSSIWGIKLGVELHCPKLLDRAQFLLTSAFRQFLTCYPNFNHYTLQYFPVELRELDIDTAKELLRLNSLHVYDEIEVLKFILAVWYQKPPTTRDAWFQQALPYVRLTAIPADKLTNLPQQFKNFGITDKTILTETKFLHEASVWALKNGHKTSHSEKTRALFQEEHRWSQPRRFWLGAP